MQSNLLTAINHFTTHIRAYNIISAIVKDETPVIQNQKSPQTGLQKNVNSNIEPC